MDKITQTVPFWAATARVPLRPALDEDLSTEVCIVGAGIAGLTIGYRLARAGTKVVILEARGVGAGETERTTAHLTVAMDEGYAQLEGIHGIERLPLIAQSHAAAIDEIERIVAREGIACDFKRVDGYLFAHDVAAKDLVKREYLASLRAGTDGLELLEAGTLPWSPGPALCYSRQGQFHPLRYLTGLSAAFEKRGGRLYCESHVEEVQGGRPARLRLVNDRFVTAEAVVIATNTPFNDRVTIHTKQACYRTYVIAATVPTGSVPEALFWDTDEPYRYVRLQARVDPERDLLIVGGEDHKTGQSDEAPDRRFSRLVEWARARFPALGEVSYRWSGQVANTIDGLAFIGRNPGDAENVFIVTGDCGQGMTHGTIAGILIPDLIAGKRHPWAPVYDPSRVRTGALKKWLRENFNVAAQYARHLLPGEVVSVQDIPPGSGAVVRRGLARIAVYRASDGTLHERSAICTHLQAVVRWNPVEKSWDCPAHGSRFTPEGKVLNGPADAELPEVEPGPTGRRKRTRGSAGNRRSTRKRSPKAKKPLL